MIVCLSLVGTTARLSCLIGLFLGSSSWYSMPSEVSSLPCFSSLQKFWLVSLARSSLCVSSSGSFGCGLLNVLMMRLISGSHLQCSFHCSPVGTGNVVNLLIALFVIADVCCLSAAGVPVNVARAVISSFLVSLECWECLVKAGVSNCIHVSVGIALFTESLMLFHRSLCVRKMSVASCLV